MSLRVGIVFEERGASQLGRSVAGVNSQLQNVGGTAGSVSRRMAMGFKSAVGSVLNLKNAFIGLGIAAGARKILEFDDAIARLQADMGSSTKDAFALRNRILDLSKEFGVAKESITGAMQVFQDFGGITKEGGQILGQLTKASKATGAEMEDLATIASTLMQTLGETPEGAIKGIEQLTAQSLAGQVSLRNLAKVLPETLAAGTGYGFTGARAVREMGTALQVAGQATGGRAQEARTLVRATLRDLSANRDAAKKLGVDVFESDGKTMRDLTDVMSELVKATGGNMSKQALGSVFTADSQLLASAFASSPIVGKVRSATGAGATEQMFKAVTEGVGAESEKLKRSIGELDAVFQKFGKTVLGFVSENAALSVGGGLAALLGLKLGASYLQGRAMRKGAGGGMGGVAGTSGATPVFVVNMPGAGVATGGSAASPGKLGTALQAAGALSAGYGIGTAFDQAFGISDKISSAMANSMKNDGITAEMNKLGVKKTLLDQFGALASMRESGLNSFELSKGNRVPLTLDNMAAAIQKSADQMGQGDIGRAVLKSLGLLNQTLSGFPDRVTVSTPGIDSASVSASRSP